MPITTHVLDTSTGRPATGLEVRLQRLDVSSEWQTMADGTTDSDGRLRTLLAPGTDVASGTYRLTFDTGAYFRARGVAAFYPRVIVEFTVRDGDQPYHVPLLVSPFGYSTYRGS